MLHERIACWSPRVWYGAVKAARGQLQNVVVALISRKSISAERNRLSKENNRDESQEALREREVLLLRLPLMYRSRVPEKRGQKSPVTRPGWSGGSALLELCFD